MTLAQTYMGRSSYFSIFEPGRPVLLVGVPCRLGDLIDQDIALLDTAAEWCVMTPTVAADLGIATSPRSPRIRLASRFGTFSGTLERVSVQFTAEDGQSVAVEATWFVAPDWSGPLVIGWRGCLERMRFAIDPTEEAIYFAPI